MILTKGYVTRFNKELLDIALARKWWADTGSESRTPYPKGTNESGSRMHQFLGKVLFPNAAPGTVDHINGYGLDNATCNLREVTVHVQKTHKFWYPRGNFPHLAQLDPVLRLMDKAECELALSLVTPNAPLSLV